MSAFRKHKVKVTVLARKCYPELQEAYLAPDFKHKGPCKLFEDGQEFVFEKFNPMHCGFPCMEAWDAISRYLYSGLQGGSIMEGWTEDPHVMVACCNDGTRPVVFKIEAFEV